MVFLHGSIYYFEVRIFWAVIIQNLKHFSVRRLLFSIFFFVIVVILQTITVILRLLDEIIFPGYRKTEIREPVFIISNPRSGTTYLHRLLSLDEERYTYFLLYHTFFPSVLFYKFILGLKWIDSKIGWPMKWFFDKVEKKVFGGWDNIHPMGFERSEEDEGLFVLQMMSPAVCLFSPWFKNMDWITIADNLPEKKKTQMLLFYKNTLQRFMYAWGKEDKIFLAKNVISTGRINMMLKIFPNARVIYPVRHPYQTIPSMISMFTKPWAFIAPKIPENSEEYRTIGDIAIRFYKHFLKQMEQNQDQRLYCLMYDEFVKKPIETVEAIYTHFGLEIKPAFRKRLDKQVSERKNYKSSHHYSLEQYGYTKEIIYQQLKAVFEKFGFEK
jgi:omega-hydroxy-beta-dihydromenaquinone-9 sulfotransferase